MQTATKYPFIYEGPVAWPIKPEPWPRRTHSRDASAHASHMSPTNQSEPVLMQAIRKLSYKDENSQEASVAQTMMKFGTNDVRPGPRMAPPVSGHKAHSPLDPPVVFHRSQSTPPTSTVMRRQTMNKRGGNHLSRVTQGGSMSEGNSPASSGGKFSPALSPKMTSPRLITPACKEPPSRLHAAHELRQSWSRQGRENHPVQPSKLRNPQAELLKHRHRANDSSYKYKPLPPTPRYPFSIQETPTECYEPGTAMPLRQQILFDPSALPHGNHSRPGCLSKAEGRTVHIRSSTLPITSIQPDLASLAAISYAPAEISSRKTTKLPESPSKLMTQQNRRTLLETFEALPEQTPFETRTYVPGPIQLATAAAIAMSTLASLDAFRGLVDPPPDTLRRGSDAATVDDAVLFFEGLCGTSGLPGTATAETLDRFWEQGESVRFSRLGVGAEEVLTPFPLVSGVRAPAVGMGLATWGFDGHTSEEARLEAREREEMGKLALRRDAADSWEGRRMVGRGGRAEKGQKMKLKRLMMSATSII